MPSLPEDFYLPKYSSRSFGTPFGSTEVAADETGRFVYNASTDINEYAVKKDGCLRSLAKEELPSTIDQIGWKTIRDYDQEQDLWINLR